MVYFDNTTETQRVHIPRTNIEASAYHPSSGGTERYYAGTNIEITPTNVINVTGMTEAISAATSDFVTSGDVQSQITSQTQNFVTSGDVETMVSGFTTTGDVETMITSATSGLATTQEVENALSGKADTTAVTQSISNALTAYTPTNGFATINGSGITSGGNIVIESGGDSTTLEKITTLPTEPVDGAVYNYNGVLIKFVNGAGKWGYWNGADVLRTYSRDMCDSATLFYGVIPGSMDGELAFGLGWIKGNTGGTQIWCYFNLGNDTIDVYDNSGKTGSVLYQIQRNAGSETYINNSSVQMYVSWKDNVIQLRPQNHYVQLLIPCTTEISTSHYELVQPLNRNYPVSMDMSLVNYTSTPSYYLTNFDYTTGEAYPGRPAYDKVIYINNSGYSSPWAYFSSNNNLPIQRMFVPTASGATGSLLVSQGDTTPIFKTIAQALGIDFWTGSQDDYDAMASHNATTLYIIVPDE